ncbi:MAG: NAD-dependent epimerase/dehydratase family protein [Halobacteriales archaeon]|nr:NAD-dependent epimerase/dehydratase family protein [Halobacteriales archaeon]
MRLLVAGGHGFLGRALVADLALAGHAVTVLDRIGPATPGQAWLPLDLLDVPRVRQALSGQRFDATAFLAGDPDIRRCEEDPLRSLHANLASLDALLGAAPRDALGHVVLASSAAVYGPDAASPNAEDAPLAPRSVYGTHKALAEERLRVAARAGVGGTALRLFNLVGPGCKGLLQLLVDSRHGNPVRLRGADQLRDFVAVDDAVRAFAAVLAEPAPGFEALNVGTGRGFRVGDLVRIAREELPGVRVEPAPLEAAPYDAVADPTRLRQRIGWVPAMDEARLRATVRALAPAMAHAEVP